MRVLGCLTVSSGRVGEDLVVVRGLGLEVDETIWPLRTSGRERWHSAAQKVVISTWKYEGVAHCSRPSFLPAPPFIAALTNW